MNNITNNKQIKKYLIAPELTNKLLVIDKSKKLSKISITNNFKLSEIKLIKNLIQLELISGLRPKIQASLLKKIMIINLSTVLNLELLTYLQQQPVSWSNYLETMNFGKLFSMPSVLVKNLKFNVTVTNKNKNQRASKQLIWIKSAYLD